MRPPTEPKQKKAKKDARAKGGISRLFRKLISRDSGGGSGGQGSPPPAKKAAGAAAADVDFGIETTDVLPHFERVKPPRRRPPRTRQCQVEILTVQYHYTATLSIACKTLLHTSLQVPFSWLAELQLPLGQVK